MIGNLKDETETENTKIDRKIRAYSKDLNLTKSIIRGTANNMERNLRLLNEDKRDRLNCECRRHVLSRIYSCKTKNDFDI